MLPKYVKEFFFSFELDKHQGYLGPKVIQANALVARGNLCIPWLYKILNEIAQFWQQTKFK